MRTGLVISTFLHAAIITFVVLGWPGLERDIDQRIDIIPVEIVTIADETIVPEPEPEPEPKPQQEPEPEPVRRVEAEPDPGEAVAPLEAEPAPPESQPQPQPPSRHASVVPRRKPEPPNRFDPGQIAALLDKRKAEEQPQHDRDDDETERDPNDNAARRSSVDEARLQASIQDAMLSQIAPCWIIPAGAPEPEALFVEIRIWLSPDGSLLRTPEILDRQRMNRPGEEYFRVAAESAWRAVQKCAPYELPKDSYSQWRNMKLNFDPSQMLGG